MIFDTDYIFKGKHAEYVKELVSEKIFDRNVDILIIAPIIGIYNNIKKNVEKGGYTTKVFLEQILGEQEKLKFVYATVIILQETLENKIEIAFKSDFSEDYEEKGMKIFNEYLCGGVEYLYKHLIEVGSKNDEDKHIDLIHEFIENFENNGIDIDAIMKKS